MRAERSAKRRVHRDLLADVGGADQIEAETAVLRRDLEAQHFLVHELGGGPAEHALFFRELLADEHLVGSDAGREELAAGERRLCLRHLLTLIKAGKYKPDIVPTINELFSLRDRVAIVTGGSRGLGQEMAEGLAEAGAALMLCARREQWLTPTVEAMRAKGFRVEGMLCDVSNADDVQAVADNTVATFGKIDILVNNAGVTWAAEPEDLPLDKWQKVVDTNLTGAFLFEEAIKASSPIPRVGDAGELKGVAVFLAADASNYITGQTIVVDGGRTIA